MYNDIGNYCFCLDHVGHAFILCWTVETDYGPAWNPVVRSMLWDGHCLRDQCLSDGQQG